MGKYLLIEEDDLLILITFAETSGLYEVGEQSCFGNFIEEALRVL